MWEMTRTGWPQPAATWAQADFDDRLRYLNLRTTLETLLRGTNVRLAVITACSTAQPAPTEEPYTPHAFDGVAQRLLGGGLVVRAAGTAKVGQGRGAAERRDALDHVGVERALREELRAPLDRLERLLEHLDGLGRLPEDLLVDVPGTEEVLALLTRIVEQPRLDLGRAPGKLHRHIDALGGEILARRMHQFGGDDAAGDCGSGTRSRRGCGRPPTNGDGTRSPAAWVTGFSHAVVISAPESKAFCRP